MCALLNDGGVVCWGYNKYGAMGIGTTVNVGDMPGQMGSSLQEVLLGAGGSNIVVRIFVLIACPAVIYPSLKARLQIQSPVSCVM